MDSALEDPSLSYWSRSASPLHALVFLLPLICLYELGSWIYLRNPAENTLREIEAKKLLGSFFELFGVAGLFLPGIALVTVLIVWHTLSREPWRVRWPTLGGMIAESAAWTIPLVVLGAVHTSATQVAADVAMVQAEGGSAGLAALPWQSRLTIAIGAGLYEEMLFRLVGIALLHTLLSDLLGARASVANACSITGAAIAFAVYHDSVLTVSGIRWSNLFFFAAAGIYLGTIYVLRGFGIAAATHTLYDVLVLVLLPNFE